MTRTALLLATALLATPAIARTRTVTRTMTVTAYCLSRCRICGTTGRTATGTRTARGIAVNTRRRGLLGSRFWVPGYGSARADDVGSGVRGLDVRMRSHREARRWGRRRLRVRITRR